MSQLTVVIKNIAFVIGHSLILAQQDLEERIFGPWTQKTRQRENEIARLLDFHSPKLVHIEGKQGKKMGEPFRARECGRTVLCILLYMHQQSL